MRVLSAAQLLDAWEDGLSRSPVERALCMLAAAWPEADRAALEALSVGERDARLLQLRQRLFGPDVAMTARCPACGQQLESAFRVADIQVDGAEPIETARVLCTGGYRIAFRLPTSRDLLSLSRLNDDTSPERALLALCVTEIVSSVDEAPTEAESLPVQVVTAVAEAMAKADPQADARLDLTCPACRHRWNAPFDIGGFLWQEVQTWAQRVLRDVTALARAYGWREKEILALSPMRREAYLELARQ